MPRHIRGKVTQGLVDKLNQIQLDPEFAEAYQENLISYTNVLNMGKFQLDKYVDAVRYVSFKLMGENNTKAYIKTFPDKYSGFKAKGVSDKDISKYVHAYNGSKLVNLIWEQSMIPFHVINQVSRQKALNVQIDLMQNAQSEKVRAEAANSVLTHLKPPETTKIELDVNMKESSVIDDLRNAVQDLTIAQERAVEAGQLNAKDVAHSKLLVDNDTQEIIDV